MKNRCYRHAIESKVNLGKILTNFKFILHVEARELLKN
jgi:hypothetical protein